jgi:hypothetical protein
LTEAHGRQRQKSKAKPAHTLRLWHAQGWLCHRDTAPLGQTTEGRGSTFGIPKEINKLAQRTFGHRVAMMNVESEKKSSQPALCCNWWATSGVKRCKATV